MARTRGLAGIGVIADATLLADTGANDDDAAPPHDGADAQAQARAREIIMRALDDSGTGFEFVQAIRLLHRIYPERAAVGHWAHPDTEVARFVVPPVLSFPPSELGSIDLPNEQDPTDTAELAVRFFGLTGTQGVLPHVYTEHASARARSRDTAFRDFLDLFHHRAISLFYRAWERHHTLVPAERGAQDRLLDHLLDLGGFGTAELQERSGLPAATLASYAGLLSMRTRPAIGLAQLVRDHFGIPAAVEQFVGEWHPVSAGGQFDIGSDGDDGRLGFAVVGDAVFDPHARVRLRVGPLTRAQFDAFLPGGSAHDRLAALARTYADAQVGIDVQLVLARTAVPQCALNDPDTPKLGFGTWLQSRPMTRDPDDVTLALC